MCINKGESYQKSRQAVGILRGQKPADRPVNNAAPAGSATATTQPLRRRNLLASASQGNGGSLLGRGLEP